MPDPQADHPRRRLLDRRHPRILRELAEARARPDDRLPRDEPGQGGRAADGFQHATGQIVIVQDADLEYDPAQYPQLIQPIVEGKADVVFGSRFIGETHRVLYFWHSLANKFLTLLSNMFTNLNLTDMEVCYKVFRREVIQGITLKSDRFGFEPEVTAKVARFQVPAMEGRPARQCRIYEMPGQLQRPRLREGQEDRLEGRLPGPLLHRPLRLRRLTDRGRRPFARHRRGAIARRRLDSAIARDSPPSRGRRCPAAPAPVAGGAAAGPSTARRPSRSPRQGEGQGEGQARPARARSGPASTWAGRSPT